MPGPRLTKADRDYLRSRGPMLDLNLDIWSQILENCATQREISRLSRTCQVLHSTGVHALSRRGIALAKRKQLESFLAYVNAEPTRRAPLVKKLALMVVHDEDGDEDYDEEFWEAAPLCTQVLQVCSLVEDLKINDGMLFRADLEFGSALSQLEHVKSLELTTLPGHPLVRDAWEAVSANMRSKCTQIKFFEEGRPCPWPGELRNPIFLLHRFRSSLTTIHFTHAFLNATVWALFPCVTTVTLDRWEQWHLGILMRSFPALRSLSFTRLLPSESKTDWRETNVATWQAAKEHWRDLDFVQSSVSALHALAIACPARRCIISKPDRGGSLDWRELAAIQRDMQFTRFSVHFDCEQHETAPGCLGLMLGDHGAVANLFGALTLNIRLKHCTLSGLIGSILDLVASRLSHTLGLQYLGIHFFCPFDGEFTTPGHTNCPARFKKTSKRNGDYQRCPELLTWVGQCEHATIAERMANALSTLEFVSLGLRPGDSRNWAVVRGPQRATVTPVIDDVTQKEKIDWHEMYTLEYKMSE